MLFSRRGGLGPTDADKNNRRNGKEGGRRGFAVALLGWTSSLGEAEDAVDGEDGCPQDVRPTRYRLLVRKLRRRESR